MSPLATHRSYRASNSSLVTAAVGKDSGIGGEIGGEDLGCAPSRTTLAHVGPAQETMPSTPSEGEAWEASSVPACLYLPSPQEGEAVWQGEGC